MLRFWIVVVVCASLVSAGDDCPSLESLKPFCTCSHYSLSNIERSQLRNFQTTVEEELSRFYSTPQPFNQTANFFSRKLFGIKEEPIGITTAPRIRDKKYYTVVECDLKAVNRTSIFLDIATKLHRKWIDKFSVTHLPLEKERMLVRLPPGWLNSFRIIQFQVEDSTLSGDFIWKQDPFIGQKYSLMWLSAVGCSLTGALTYDTLGTVNLKGLEQLRRLEGIDLSRNHLVSIEASAFSHVHQQLRTIILSRNVLQNIEEGTFRNIPMLEHVDFSNNVLENISRSVFSSKPDRLKHINLSWNHFQTLPKDLFANMSSLKKVDFSNNFLHSLPQEPWKVIWKDLHYIDVSNNFIECNCELIWLVASENNYNYTGRTVTGQCGRTLPSVYVVHYDLDNLNRSHISCNDNDELDNQT